MKTYNIEQEFKWDSETGGKWITYIVDLTRSDGRKEIINVSRDLPIFRTKNE